LAKFIIVVPSVAIREGVLKNIEITAEHFRALYGNVEFEHFVYDAKRIPQLRQFAVSNTIQILIINIDAFGKNFTGTDAERKSNVIYKETDRLQGRQPIEFIQATNPIVIIDEPQSVDSTEKAQEAIKALKPLCTLRYSATHRNPYNLVYRLDPIRSLQMGLVKQIVVGSTRTQNAHNAAFVRLEKTDNKKGIKAKVTLHVSQESGIAEKNITVKAGDDLFYKSGERELYRQGYEVVDIYCEPGAEYIQFSSGKRLALGESQGGFGDDIARLQIRKTVEKHLLKELEVRDRAKRGEGVKVLTLFFLDHVGNYRTYDAGGAPQKGPYALLFEETLAEFLKETRFAPLLPYAPIRKVGWRGIHGSNFVGGTLKALGKAVEGAGDRVCGRGEQATQYQRHQLPLAGRQGVKRRPLEILGDEIVETLFVVGWLEWLRERDSLGVTDVFQYVPTERALADWFQALLEVIEATAGGELGILSLEAGEVAKGVFVNEANEAVKLHERILERSRGKQKLPKRREHRADDVGDFSRRLVNVAKTMGLVDDHQTPFYLADVGLLVASKVVGANDDGWLLKWIQISSLNVLLERLRLKDHRR
jgi:hypothetical protein